MSPLPPREVREDLQSGDTQGSGCGFSGDVRAYEGWGPLVRELILEFLSTLRLGEFILAMRLHTEDEMESLGFVRYWSKSERMIPKKGDLHAHWRSISTDGDLLGPLPSYTLIRDLVLRLCHRMMAHSIVRRSQAPEKFVAQLAKHFRLLTVDILRGLMVIDPKLPIIDMERQSDVAVGAPEGAEDAPVIDEGSQADSAPVQASQQPPPPQPPARTMLQRMARL
nr:hypothetical protein [Tanacetum cinerariifolium]